MLMTMKSMNEAMAVPCVLYFRDFDKSTKHEDSEMRVSYELELGILIPVVKGLCASSAMKSHTSVCRCMAGWATLKRRALRST